MLSSCGATRQGLHTKIYPRLRKIETEKTCYMKKKKKVISPSVDASEQAGLGLVFAEKFSF